MNIQIDKVNPFLHGESLGNMLYDYMLELRKINNSVRLRSKEELIKEYFDDISDFYLVYVDNVVAGFYILQDVKNIVKGCDKYIEEFYIKPSFRGKGVGTYTAKDAISKCGKTVLLCVLNGNNLASIFWKKMFEDYEDTSSTKKFPGGSNVTWYSYTSHFAE